MVIHSKVVKEVPTPTMSPNSREIPLLIFSFLLAYTVLPFFMVLVVCPLLLYWKIVVLLSKLRQDFVTELSLRSCVTAVDKVYSKPNCNIVVQVGFEDKIDAQEAKRRVKIAIESGKHPELECHLSRWLGVFFWRKCKDFELDNHVKLNLESEQGNVSAYFELISKQPFGKDRPVWDITIFPNHVDAETGTKCTVALRVHHSLCDASSVIFLAQAITDRDDRLWSAISDKIKKFKEKASDVSLWHKLFYIFHLVFLTPGLTLFHILQSFDSNPLTLKKGKRTKNVRQYEVLSDLDLEMVKRAAKVNGVSVSSILVSGWAAACRKLTMEITGRDVQRDMTMQYTFPAGKHPGNLTTNVFPIPLRLPTSEADPAKRLAVIEDQLQNVFNCLLSPLPQGFLAFMNIMGLLFCLSGKETYRKDAHYGTMIYSSVVYFGDVLRFQGIRAPILRIWGGRMQKGYSLFAYTFSYNGKLLTGIKYDPALFPGGEGDDAKRFIGFVREEVECLEKVGFDTKGICMQK